MKNEIERLYVFGIGGTGERVLRSLMMLIAGGMPMNCKVIKPVFIDSDSGSMALRRANELIAAYRKTKQLLDLDANYLANTDVKVNSSFHVEVEEPILLNVSGTNIKDLKTLIDAVNMEDNMKAEFNALYSKHSQEMNLSWGFVGNPSIGSIVLNQMLEGELFRNLGITNRDGVFIVSSIFGGTGAAGFPLIVNSLRKKFENNFDGIRIGALSIFPYFDLRDVDDQSEVAKTLVGYDIVPDDFSTKTKAALNYYATYVKALSSMYYLGSHSTIHRSVFEKHLGGEKQDNPACLIEVWGAKAISHFTYNADGLTNDEDRSGNFKTQYYEYFTDKEPTEGGFYDLSSVDTDENLKEVFVRLQLLKYIWKDCVPEWIDTKGNQWSTSIKMNKGGYDNMMGTYLRQFLDMFDQWAKELKSDCHKFRFRFFNEDEADSTQQNYITQRFFPTVAHMVPKGLFSKENVPVDPEILGLMQKECNKNVGDGFKEDKIRQQFAFFTSLYAIEHILHDTDKYRKINLQFNN